MASEKSEASHLPPAWPELPPQEVPTSWPEAPRQDPVPAWAEPPKAGDGGQSAWSNLNTPAPWPPRDTPQQGTWPPQPSADRQPPADPFAPLNPDPFGQRLGAAGTAQQPPTGPHSSASGGGHQENPPLPAWAAQEPAAAPPPPAWPQEATVQAHDATGRPAPEATGRPMPDATGRPMPEATGRSAPSGDPLERTVAYTTPPPADHTRPGGSSVPGDTGRGGHAVQPGQNGQPGQLGQGGQPGQDGRAGDSGRPGGNLGRDPSDPDRPFVTAGQISGSRTPPPDRQQELWNAVFSDADQEDSFDEPGKPVWIYALSGSVAVALVIGLVWAFLAGPLASEKPSTAASQPAKSPATPSKSAPATSRIPRLPKYPGEASPVMGRLTDAAAGINIPRLGGKWLLDQRPLVQSTYGYRTRQYVQTGLDATGKPVFAQVLTGPLPAKLAAAYTGPDSLEQVIRKVVVDARKRFFPVPNTVKTAAREKLKVGGQVNAYSLKAGDFTATVVVAAVNTGGDVPAIVYMAVPGDSKALLPDVNTVFKSIKLNTAG
ncbi:hypothetical protein [Thermoactinospora rubra]|uniref:hypothetical protein n=1 Tax=Thermoactinospora rubra TaxID=1088767 RepID=UPI000A1191DB|nr:hypothetical protein [Thermoactinospora rubra]